MYLMVQINKCEVPVLRNNFIRNWPMVLSVDYLSSNTCFFLIFYRLCEWDRVWWHPIQHGHLEIIRLTREILKTIPATWYSQCPQQIHFLVRQGFEPQSLWFHQIQQVVELANQVAVDGQLDSYEKKTILWTMWAKSARSQKETENHITWPICKMEIKPSEYYT